MMRILSIAFAVSASLALTACFVTKTPLITGANAVFPFTGGTAFKSYSWKEEENTWEESGSGTVLRNGDHYTLHPDPEPGHQPDAGDDVNFLLADLGDGYYAAEATDMEDDVILLDVIKREGDTVLQYVLMCAPEDKPLVASHIIDSYEHGEFNDTCTVSSLAQLRKAFDAKLNAGMIPHGKHVPTR